MKAKKIVAILAIAAMLVVPATAFASEFKTSPRTVVEGHTTYAVVVREQVDRDVNEERHEFAAVAGFARHYLANENCDRTRNNGVLWFNDQFFIDAQDVIVCVLVVVEDCTVGCYILAAELGDADPELAYTDPTLVNTFVYGYTDPNGVAWTTSEFSYAAGAEFFWQVAIGATTQDAAANLPGGTSNRGTASSPTPNLGTSDNTNVNGCTAADTAGSEVCGADPDADGGGIDHNPVGDGPNVRAYNFVVLIDMNGSVGGPGSATAAKLDVTAQVPVCAFSASDDGNSHASQAVHSDCSGPADGMHRTGAVDLWFTHNAAPAVGGLVRAYGSAFAYHT